MFQSLRKNLRIVHAETDLKRIEANKPGEGWIPRNEGEKDNKNSKRDKGSIEEADHRKQWNERNGKKRKLVEKEMTPFKSVRQREGIW